MLDSANLSLLPNPFHYFVMLHEETGVAHGDGHSGNVMLSKHAAARVSSLFFLTPALSTIEGAVLFRERLGVLAVLGLAVALCGVWLTMRAPESATPLAK